MHKTSGILDLECVQRYNDKEYHTQAFLENSLMVPDGFAERTVAIRQLGWPSLLLGSIDAVRADTPLVGGDPSTCFVCHLWRLQGDLEDVHQDM